MFSHFLQLVSLDCLKCHVQGKACTQLINDLHPNALTYGIDSHRLRSMSDFVTRIGLFSSLLQEESGVKTIVNNSAADSHIFLLGLERYWYWVIGYWAIFTDIG